MTVDESAEIGAFLAALRPRAVRLAFAEVRDAALAADLVQDAMLKLVQYYAKRPAGEWTPLFYRILRNRITDWRRRRRFENLIEHFGFADEDGSETPWADFPDPGPGPDRLLSDARLGRKIMEALARLPERQRQVFLLREWEGLSVADTGAAMGVSEGSVKTHHFRALARLREWLQDERPEGSVS